MSPSSTYLPAPEGPGAVCGALNLPEGFTDASTNRYVDTGEVRLHAVAGGEGPQLLLVLGWPGNWYAWRPAMSTLAALRDFLAPNREGGGGLR